MKRFWVVLSITLIIPLNIIFAQEKSLPFFEKNGNVAIQTSQIDALADTISVINHRADDIVWSRIVYRIIDMRDKQNNQLYFPIVPNEKYKSLFRLIVESTINDTMPLNAYEKIESDIQPMYDKQVSIDKLRNLYVSCDWDSVNNKILKSPLIEKDPLTNQNKISSYNYPDFASKQIKFVIQEIVFFNKHYSRMYTKIIGIAPVFTYNETNVTNLNLLGARKTGDAIWNYFQSSIVCWYLFDELRPYLAKQYVIPNGNDTQRMSYDEFFAQKLYSSYLLGDSNMFNRMLIQAYTNPDLIVKEQKRIETEIMNVEQDLWEY